MDDNGIQPDCFTAARRWSSNASVIRGSQPKTSLSGIFLRSTLLFIAFANIIPWDFHLSTRSKKCIENFYQNLFVLTTAFFIFFTASARTWIVWINFLFYVDCTCVFLFFVKDFFLFFCKNLIPLWQFIQPVSSCIYHVLIKKFFITSYIIQHFSTVCKTFSCRNCFLSI